ncbi:enoyl-CoA hydratase-related protein [Sphingobium sp. Sx8-8]|uniref:enoyl-CoA hydratase/isomerase family protein n=1 Tax=Sphingobium sp. Sx8-8 TaxID=2933617 RepID=UPI001F5868C7|nr:enoyl-CoA hydratase-related protein [Sphingobium sp. Sx8-8]
MDEVITRIEDHVGIITMNRPDRLNAMNIPLMARLREAVADAYYNDEIRCVVLTGAGRGFCAGGDMKGDQPSSASLPIDQRIYHGRRTIDTGRMLHDMGKPTIAMINGPVAGAGIGLAGACDLRFASTTATFTPAFDQRGYSGDYGSTYFWTKIVGAGAVRKMFILGRQLDAETAYRQGIYSELFAPEDLERETMAIAKTLAANHVSAWRLMKSSLNTAEDSVMETALDMEVNNMVLSMQLIREKRAAQSS